MLSSGVNLAATVIAFGMSFTFIVYICARFIYARTPSPDSRPSASTAAFDLDLPSDLHLDYMINGLEPVMIAAIPTMKYNQLAFKCEEHLRCTICLTEYRDKEILRIMPICGHNFHVACIDVWFQKQSTCPICRLSLNDSFAEKYTASPILGARSENGSELGDEHCHSQPEICESISVFVDPPHVHEV